jgi:hypothetical protein
MNEYINPLYSSLATPDILMPNIAPQNIKFWRGMYCRFESGVHPREPLGDLLLATCDHSSSLEDHIRLLTKVNLFCHAVVMCTNIFSTSLVSYHLLYVLLLSTVKIQIIISQLRLMVIF